MTLFSHNAKRCAACGETKALDEFPRNKNYADGRHCNCKPCHNAQVRESRMRLHGGSRHYHLKRRYGIGAADVDALIEAQGGTCPVCGRPDPEHVDHDHRSGTVRGILCFNCNGGLGQFGDDVDRLAGAIRYLDAQRDNDGDALVAVARARAKELIATG
jgi:hypothetical protein